jgi:nitrogen regulation protein NR(I)
MKSRILIADDEASLRKVLSAALRREGYDVVAAQDGDEALQLLDASTSPETGEPFDLLISDVRMPGVDGLELLDRVKERFDDLPVVLLTAHGTVDMAVQALKQGAFDFVTKPYERDEFLQVLRKALGQREADAKESRPRPDKNERGLVGSSKQIASVLEIIDKVASTPSTVLITGESGTGKELVAMALHQGSKRADKPFIKINCAAIPPTLIEAELFGHEKGAFTGAVTSKPGRFELADGGTLFLDEIGELPVELQVKLLRALQESTFERVGGIKTITVDVRLIAATNRDLEKAIEDGAFREDLYYRLNVVPIPLPALRERPEDIPLLVEHFLEKFNERLDRKVERLSEGALDALRAYSWPGNIRELENIIERTVLFSEGELIDKGDLPPDLVAKIGAVAVRPPAEGAPDIGDASMKDIVRQATAELERDLIARALDETQGNVTHAARRLKISRKSLQIKMKDLGLREEGAPAAKPADEAEAAPEPE